MLRRTKAGILLLGTVALAPFTLPYFYMILAPPALDYAEQMSTIYVVLPCLSVVVIATMLALAGALMAIWGRSWRRTLFVAFFAIFTLGPFFLGTFLASVAFLMLVLARDEFPEHIEQRYGPDLLGSPTTRTPPTGPR